MIARILMITKKPYKPRTAFFFPVVHHMYSNIIFLTVTQNQVEPIFIYNVQELQACLYVTIF